MNIRALMAAVIGMGVLIVAGVAVLGFTIVHRLAGPSATGMTLLDEPPGTHVVQVSAAGDRLALLLQGGGVDRIVLLDPRTGQVAGRVALAR